ncbi:MAG TPA: hypothetical protein VJY35_06295, partial [Candidatus Eisenbacteria bacterium]|nr:hypothetical protein [Candidatus Eisenbacteria bacterium]
REQPWLAFLSWLPVPLGVLALWLPAWPPLARRIAKPWASLLFFALTRVVFAWVVFGVLGHRSWDWSGFLLQSQAALEGRLPYRDFPSLFAPGLPYLFGAALALSPEWGLLALFLLADLGTFLLLARLPGGRAPSRDSAAWAYLAFPPVWYFEIRYGQEEAVAALFVALALVALARGRGLLAGLALAAGQLVTKLLFGLAALPLLLGSRATMATRLAYLIPVGLVYAAMTVAGLPWMRELSGQAGEFGSGPTLWRLPQLWLGFELGRFAMVPFVVALAIGWWRLIRRTADGVSLLAWCWGCFALLAPKLLPMYVVMVAPGLAVWVAREGGRGRFLWWGLYGFALATVWYADSGPVQGLFGPVGVALGAGVIVLTVALDLWLLREVWRKG